MLIKLLEVFFHSNHFKFLKNHDFIIGQSQQSQLQSTSVYMPGRLIRIVLC